MEVWVPTGTQLGMVVWVNRKRSSLELGASSECCSGMVENVARIGKRRISALCLGLGQE